MDIDGAIKALKDKLEDDKESYAKPDGKRAIAKHLINMYATNGAVLPDKSVSIYRLHAKGCKSAPCVHVRAQKA
jgi:hypothetical protein